MSASALIIGSLFRAPEQRTSKAGRPFVTATLKAKNGDSVEWWKILAFSETVCADLMRLGDGDALSAQGALKAETYEKDGATRIGFTVMCEQAAGPGICFHLRR